MNNQIQLVLKSSTTELSLNDHELGIYLTPELDGLTGLPEIRTTSGVNAGYDGGWTSAQNYDARSITIRGVIANEDVATVEQLRRQLTTLAGQGKNEELTLDLVTQAGKAYTIQVRTIALEMSLQKVLTQQEFMLQLRADDPLIYDASETTHEALLQVAQATGGFTIDFELPLAITGSSEETIVNNEGLEQVPTVTRMYGELHNPKIINQTTNQSMQIMADLGYAEGDWIEPSEVVSGKDITINGAPEGAPLSSVQIDGNTSQQTYSGKNLMKYPYRDTTVTRNGITFTDNGDGTVTANGTATTETLFWITNDIWSYSTNNIVIPAGTYTISKTGRDKVHVYVTVYGKTHGQIGSFNVSTSDATFTTTEEASLTIRLSIKDVGATISNFVFRPQIENGSTSTAYEPYVGGVPAPNPDYPQAVQTVTGENVVEICGKNLYNEMATPWVATTHYNTTTGAIEAWANYYGIREYQPVSASTQYVVSSAASGNLQVVFYDGSKTFLSATSGSPSFTTPANCQYVRWSRYTETAPTNTQLELGSTATEYQPYRGQSYEVNLGNIELCKIGTYQDSIYKSGGKWYLHKEVGISAGSELGWRKGGAQAFADTTIFYDLTKKSMPIGPALSNYLRYSANNYGANDHNSISITSSAEISIRVSNSIATDITAFTDWLDTNGVIIYYSLATPTDTEITNEALVAQLEALAAATMYNPQTNITTLYAEGNEQQTLDVSYFTDKNPDTRDELIIDSRLRTITLNGLDVYHLQAPGSEFLMLAPGENRLSLQSDITGDNGYAQVSYKQGYLSI